MTRRLPILVLALVLALGLAWLWGSVSGPTENESHEALGGLDIATGVLEPEPVSGLPDPAGIAPAAESTERIDAAPAPEAPLGKLAAPIPGDALWVTGRVIFPDNLPLDESFKLVASGRRFGGRKSSRKHTVEADPAGRFRIAFAKQTSTGTLTLQARYMYLESRLRLKPKESQDEIELRPLLGGVLQGVVRPPAGHEVNAETFEDVRVRVQDWRRTQSFIKTAVVTEDGSYEILGLPPSSYDLTLVSSKFAEEDRDEVGIHPGKVTQLDLALTLGVHLAGHILTAEGEPVQGAQANLLVTREAHGGSYSVSKTAVSDAEGQFTFKGLNPGKMTLSVRVEGAQEIVDELGSLEDGVRLEQLVYRTSQGRTVSGVVRWDDGSAAAGIRVEGRPIKAGGGLERNVRKYMAKTDDLGAFELEGLDERRIVIDASGRRTIDGTESESLLGRKKRGPTLSARMEDVQPGTRGLQLVLSTGEVLRGSVLFVGGDSVGSFAVTATPDSQDKDSLDRNDTVSRTFKAKDGEYELTGLKPGNWRITVKGKRFAETDGSLVHIPRETRLDFTVALAASLQGKVVSPGGEPLAGVKLTVVEVHGNSRIWKEHGERTDSRGEFTIKSMAPGEYELKAESSGWAPAVNLAFQLAPGESREGLVLAMQPAARLTGLVLPAAGNVVGRTIVVWKANGGSYESTTSDDDGHFEFSTLGAGKYNVQLQTISSDPTQPQEFQVNSARIDVDLVTGLTSHVELGAGPAQPIRVHGRVTSGGVGVPKSSLRFRASRRAASALVQADESGAYSVVVDGSGTYSVTVRAAGSQRGINENSFSVKVQTTSEQREDFELPTASLKVSLLRPDGSAAVGALVGLERIRDSAASPGSSPHQQADEQGGFVFEHLEPGNYVLYAGGDSTWEEDGGGFARHVSELTIPVGATQEQTVRLDESARVAGTATYTDGVPVQHLQVRAYDSAGHILSLRWNSTDEAGHFILSGLPSGTLRIEVGQPGRALGSNTVQLSKAGFGEVHVSVSR